MSATAAYRPPLSAAICETFSLLGGSAPGRLGVDARSPGGLGHQQFYFHTDHPFAVVPPQILEFLEQDPPWGMRVCVPVMEADAACALLRTSAITATFHFERRMEKALLVWPKGEMAQTRDRLADLTVLPTFVIDARAELCAGWALDHPIDLTTADGAATVRELKRAIAVAVGALVPDNDASLADTLPVPGSIARPYQDVVTCEWIEADRRYSINQLMRVAGVPKKGQQTT